jgi:raffinose/stachyose/melibiose transport system substrate-binding protein
MTTAGARLRAAGLGGAVAASIIVAGAASAQDEPVTLTFLVGEVEATQVTTKALADAYTALHPNVTFEFETVPSGTEGDNITKTRLATGEMTDIFWYNSGSLLQALNPSETLVDISGEPFIANIAESFLPTVSSGDAIFGVPGQTAMGGGLLYNTKVYSDLGLTVPTTWEEFAANNEAIKAADIAPVGATFGGSDTWTSQLFVLADNCNVLAADPDFATKYTANEAHYSDTPAALAGFQHLQEGFEKGWWQEDFGSTLFSQGLNLLAEGQVAHYPMLTFALGEIAANNPEAVQDIGFFGQPGTDAASNCATLWMPSAIYIAQTSEHIDVAKDFLAFVASVEGTDAITAAYAPTGPYLIKGATLPDDALPAVKELQTYIDNNAAAPALEFLSPVKGPSLENITVAVGSGLNSAEEGAALYDQDVQKQAQQLGLPGW